MVSRTLWTAGRRCCFEALRRLRPLAFAALGQVEQVGAFGLVELEGACEGLQHGLGHAGEVPALESGVVVGADAGEQGDLLAA
jgi:hypothetical protein